MSNAPTTRRFLRAASVCLMVGCLLASASLKVHAGDKVIDWNKKLEKERLLLKTNNIEEAMQILQDYLKKHPEAGALHTDMGICLKKRGKVSEAKAEFQRSTEVEPGYAEAWYELGAINQSDRQYDMAVEEFERYLQVAPDSDRKNSVKDRINYCKSQM